MKDISYQEKNIYRKDQTMDKASIIQDYIRKHLPKAEQGEVASYIAEMSGINTADIERYLKLRSGVSRMLGKLAQGSDRSAAELEYLESETGFERSVILTMNYYFRKFQIHRGLDDNKYFIMIYPTLESYLEAEDMEVAVIVQENSRQREAEPEEKSDDVKAYEMT